MGDRIGRIFHIIFLARPLEGSCKLELIKFDDPRGQETFWHSTAHMVGEALEDQFSAQLTYGPPISSGFFYDSWMGGAPFTDKLKEQLEKRVMKIAGEKQALAARAGLGKVLGGSGGRPGWGYGQG